MALSHLPQDQFWRDIVLRATAVEYIPAAAVIVVGTPGQWPSFLEHSDWDLEAARAYCHDAGVEYIQNDLSCGTSILAGREWHRRKLESGTL